MALIVDERRYDIPRTEACTPGEARSIRYSVREKTNGVFAAATSFAAYSDWEFYLYDKLGDGGLDQTARQAAAIFYVEAASFTLSAPYATVPMTEAQTALVNPGMRAHELWVKIGGAWSRVSYGDVPFVT